MIDEHIPLSPIQKKMYEALSDGELHSIKELHAYLGDELAPLTNVYPHIRFLRKRLPSRGYTVVLQRVDKKTYYRLVRYIVPSSAE